MPRYLLAAEADRIQDLIFRSARLREVAGGSQLLTRFCDEVPRLLSPEAQIVVNDGGSFRILFKSEEDARAFGDRLAEVYRRAIGGTLTIAEPVEVAEPVEEHFAAASEQAERSLRRAKFGRKGWQAQDHLPYVAFCASCGVGLAMAHRAYHEEEAPQYLCASCLNKSAERAEQRAEDRDSFLGRFYHTVVQERPSDWPGREKRRGRPERDPVEDVADYDPRRHVAYLLADGNEMGRVFSACRTPEQMRELSCGLSEVMRQALAAPTQAVMKNHPLPDRPDWIPVWPLILGGDDLFALIPAPWALDFARCFCLEYEKKMTALLERIGLKGILRPTVSAAVVICKSKHPYALAHAAGEVRLQEAKRISKRWALEGKTPPSAINFEVVLGGRLVAPANGQRIRSTLRPYWATDMDTNGRGLSLARLIEQRFALRAIPHKRLAELRDLYDDPPPSVNQNDMNPWKARLDWLLQRIGRREGDRKAVQEALTTLGDPNRDGYWRRVGPSDDSWYGHGLPDLLEAWDFAFALDRPLSDYEEER